MSTQTLEKTTPTSTATTTKRTTAKAVSKRKDSKLRTGWRRLVPKKGAGGFPVVMWTGFFRTIVLLADYLLAFVTAVVVIPLLGAWLHQQSGASRGALSADGTVAMWLMPLLFLVVLLAAGEIVAMRAMWRWATRMIAKIRDAREEVTAADATPKSTAMPATRSKDSRKGSK